MRVMIKLQAAFRRTKKRETLDFPKFWFSKRNLQWFETCLFQKKHVVSFLTINGKQWLYITYTLLEVKVLYDLKF